MGMNNVGKNCLFALKILAFFRLHHAYVLKIPVSPSIYNVSMPESLGARLCTSVFNNHSNTSQCTIGRFDHYCHIISRH